MASIKIMKPIAMASIISLTKSEATRATTRSKTIGSLNSLKKILRMPSCFFFGRRFLP